MEVNPSNAVAVFAIFNALADARFSMRTPAAIRKAAELTGDTLPDGAIADVAAQIGLRLRRRLRDDAILVQRPAGMTAAGAKETADRAIAIGRDGAAPFELDYTAGPVLDAETSVGEDLLTDDEDTHFN